MHMYIRTCAMDILYICTYPIVQVRKSTHCLIIYITAFYVCIQCIFVIRLIFFSPPQARAFTIVCILAALGLYSVIRMYIIRYFMHF